VKEEVKKEEGTGGRGRESGKRKEVYIIRELAKT
jgi:hypothetical protein